MIVFAQASLYSTMFSGSHYYVCFTFLHICIVLIKSIVRYNYSVALKHIFLCLLSSTFVFGVFLVVFCDSVLDVPLVIIQYQKVQPKQKLRMPIING